MKVFWGGGCPEEAVFFWDQYLKNVERVTKLPRPQSFKPVHQEFSPGKIQWCAMVEKALSEIERGTLEKVVLSRKLTLTFQEPPDPWAVAAALVTKAQGATPFCFVDQKKALVGASPEHLFRREGAALQSEAMAGTRPIGSCFHDKEHRELTPVITFLTQTLSPLTLKPPLFAPRTTRKTTTIEHLLSTCRAILKPQITDMELIHALHPTPSISGAPQSQALSLIQELEPFSRARYHYAIPIGWRSGSQSEYLVTIRSCLIEDNQAHLITGVGVVAGSDPDAEWEELNQKLALYEGVLL